MKFEDVKIGMKVVPFQKTFCNKGYEEISFKNNAQLSFAKDINQSFLYVIKKDDRDNTSLLYYKDIKIENADGGWFYCSDFEPYVEKSLSIKDYIKKSARFRWEYSILCGDKNQRFADCESVVENNKFKIRCELFFDIEEKIKISIVIYEGRKKEPIDYKYDIELSKRIDNDYIQNIIDVWIKNNKEVKNVNKIDWCKVFGVKEGQEFKVNNHPNIFSFRNNKLSYKGEKDKVWKYCPAELNEIESITIQKNPYEEFCTVQEIKDMGINITKDQYVLVSHNDLSIQCKRHFSYIAGFSFYTYEYGKTSFTNGDESNRERWALVKLVKEK